MNEDLIQLAYSKFNTDADYETFKADLLANEDLQKMAHAKFETDADFETFRGDLLGEKKNPNQNEPSGESLEENGSLDSSDIPTEDGSLDSQDISDDPMAERKEKGSILHQMFPTVFNKETEGIIDPLSTDYGKAFEEGAQKAVGGILGIPNLINKGLFSLAAPDEVQEEINKLPPKEREKIINGFMDEMTPLNQLFDVNLGLSQMSAEAQDAHIERAEGWRAKMTQYDKSITEDLGDQNWGQAGHRIAVEGVGSVPSIIQAMIPYVGLASVAGGSAANKQESLEAEGKDIDLKSVSNSVLTGAIEGLLEKYTAKQGGKLLSALSGKAEKVVLEGVQGFIKGLKEIGEGALKEGGTEALQAAGENLVDAITTGNDKKAKEIFMEISDSFIIGLFVGTPMKGGEVVSNNLRAGVEQKNMPEGGKVDLDIPAVAEPAEGEAIGDPKNPDSEVTDNQEVVIDENPVEETDVDDSPDIETTATNTINEGRNKGLSDAEIIETVEDQEQKRTAEIILQREKHQSISTEEAYETSKKEATKAREQQSKTTDGHLTAAEQAVNKSLDLLVDRQGSVKKSLKVAGLSSTINHMVAKLGAASAAKHLSDEAHKKTFDRLSQEDVRSLEEIILLKNITSIDSERTRLGKAPVKHQGGQTGVSATKALEGYKAELGEKKFNELEAKAKNYFDINRELLKTAKSEGLISDAVFESIITRDYQSRVYLDFLEDMEGNFLSEELDNFETSSLSAEQVKSMRGGSEGSQSMDSQTLQQRSILARTKAVFANKLNRSFANELTPALEQIATLETIEKPTKAQAKKLRHLKELNSNVKVDKIIGFSETTGKPKYALEKANTKGFKPIYYYKDGVANRIFIKEGFFEKFTDTSNQILNASTREGISKASGTRLVKSLATGNNPLFLVTNVPRDLAFALAFSKEYGQGSKTFVPVELLKLLRDFGKGAGQALSKGSMYKKYIEYGGGMDFLTIQGRYGKEGIFNKYVEGKIADKLVDFGNKGAGRKAKDFMKWIQKINTASEFATRIAVFDRSIKNQLKKMGVKNIDALTKEKQDKVYAEAVRSARELTDFNQGGKFTKALDSGIPYLNAATQGTRSAVENFKERPIETTSRILQITSGFTALTMTAAFSLIGSMRDDNDEEAVKLSKEEIYFETLKGISAYDLRNYYVFPTGKKDRKGQWEYYRIAKAQALSPFINTSEHYLRKFYSESHGIEYKQDIGKELWETVNLNILPLELNPLDAATRVPMVDAAFAWNGIDSYTGNPLDWKHGKIPAELEGIVDDRVEGFYKKLGEEMGVSPVRMKSVTESFITTPSTNPFVGFGYWGAEAISGGEKSDFSKDFINAAGRRFKKSTSDYNEISKGLAKVNDQVVDAYAKHIKVEAEVRKAVRKAKIDDSADEVDAVLTKIFKDQPEMAEKAISWAKSELEKKKLNPFVNSLKFERNKEVRAIILAEKFGDALLKSEDHYTDKEKAIAKELIKEKVLDKDTYAAYKKLFE